MNKIQEEIHNRALRITEEFHRSQSQLEDLYRKIAQEESLQIENTEASCGEEKFSMKINADLILRLIEIRKQFNCGKEELLSLHDVLEKLIGILEPVNAEPWEPIESEKN